MLDGSPDGSISWPNLALLHCKTIARLRWVRYSGTSPLQVLLGFNVSKGTMISMQTSRRHRSSGRCMAKAQGRPSPLDSAAASQWGGGRGGTVLGRPRNTQTSPVLYRPFHLHDRGERPRGRGLQMWCGRRWGTVIQTRGLGWCLRAAPWTPGQRGASSVGGRDPPGGWG